MWATLSALKVFTKKFSGSSRVENHILYDQNWGWTKGNRKLPAKISSKSQKSDQNLEIVTSLDVHRLPPLLEEYCLDTEYRLYKPCGKAEIFNIARNARKFVDFGISNPPKIAPRSKILNFHENQEFSSPRGLP